MPHVLCECLLTCAAHTLFTHVCTNDLCTCLHVHTCPDRYARQICLPMSHTHVCTHVLYISPCTGSSQAHQMLPSRPLTFATVHAVCMRGVAWRGVAWRGVAWHGTARRSFFSRPRLEPPTSGCRQTIVFCSALFGYNSLLGHAIP